jgi:GPH family glycoside/pentoside/hexuronide:cation symporter/oligogalacturonide transporter
MYVSAFICLDVVSALASYYASQVWLSRRVNLFGAVNMKFSSMFIIAPLMVSAACMYPAVRGLMKTKGKQTAFRIGLPFYILGAVTLAAAQPSWKGGVYIVIAASLVMGVGFAGAQMMPWLIFPDTVDVAELKLGCRPTGSFSGLMTLLRKVAGGFAILVIGIVFEFSGQIPGMTETQPESAVLAIRLLLGCFIAVFISLAYFASFQYKVTNAKLERIKYFNDLGRKGLLPGLGKEENDERIALIKELAGHYDKAYDTEYVVNRKVAGSDTETR